MRRLKKNIFLGLFGGTVLLLGAARLIYPEIRGAEEECTTSTAELADKACQVAQQGTPLLPTSPAKSVDAIKEEKPTEQPAQTETKPKWHPVRSVASYSASFPDLQDVQSAAAQRWGVPSVRDRKEAELRKKELVYVGASPFFCIDKRMNHSIPYLVPRASRLLNMIGRNYLDSLYVKGVPLHRIIVSSVLRTEADVAHLRKRNPNATGKSCHLYGTTFDICYNRFSTVSPPEGPERRAVQNDTLKWVLSEVLRDIREQGHCYIKYEVKQACFHITVR